jgi:hypothetical protein
VLPPAVETAIAAVAQLSSVPSADGARADAAAIVPAPVVAGGAEDTGGGGATAATEGLIVRLALLTGVPGGETSSVWETILEVFSTVWRRLFPVGSVLQRFVSMRLDAPDPAPPANVRAEPQGGANPRPEAGGGKPSGAPGVERPAPDGAAGAPPDRPEPSTNRPPAKPPEASDQPDGAQSVSPIDLIAGAFVFGMALRSPSSADKDRRKRPVRVQQR